VKPTSHVNDHLRLEGNTLNILKVDFEELNMLGAYKDNKAAKYFFFTRSHSCLLMLNSFIERWGLQVLEKKDEFWDKAQTAGLLSSVSEVDRILSETLLRTSRANTLPQVRQSKLLAGG